MTGTGIVIGVVVLVGLLLVSRSLLAYWQQEINMTDDDHEFDRRVASYNDRIANTKRDDEIVRILRGRDTPTVSDRYLDDDE